MLQLIHLMSDTGISEGINIGDAGAAIPHGNIAISLPNYHLEQQFQLYQSTATKLVVLR